MTIPYGTGQATPASAAVVSPFRGSRPRLTFVGTGYLGATYAICFAELGYEVLGCDVDQAKIAVLASGSMPPISPTSKRQ